MSGKQAGKFIDLPDGLRVHYQESGSGEVPVLFVPGWTMTTEVFHRQLAFFHDSADYRFITLDPRSHGLSSKSNVGNHYEQHGRDLHEFIESLALADLVLCGWSFGTLATLAYVNQFGSDRLSGFIMLDGPPRATGEDAENDWVTYTHNDQSGEQAFYTMGKLRDPEATNIKFAEWMLKNRHQQAVEWIVQMSEQTPLETAALLNAAANFLDYRQDLIVLSRSVPIWCMVRESQGAMVRNWCERHLDAPRVSAFGEHMMFWEDADRFNVELLNFLNDCRQKSISQPG